MRALLVGALLLCGLAQLAFRQTQLGLKLGQLGLIFVVMVAVGTVLVEPVSAEEFRIELRTVIAKCMADDIAGPILTAGEGHQSQIGLDHDGAVWSTYQRPDASWALAYRDGAGQTCIVSAGHPGSWLSVLPE